MPDRTVISGQSRLLASTPRRSWPADSQRRPRAALLPGRSDPTPILRLHYQGSADHWAIAIYKDSACEYTEAELPGSFGEATGTPEEGTDDILVRYADPEPETDRAHPDTRQNCESRVCQVGFARCSSRL